MNKNFFQQKIKEVRNLFESLRTKTKQRNQGLKDDSGAKEKQRILNSQPEASQDKVLRESGGQDITAI